METPVLTREQVERASRREGYEQHPVIRVIEYHEPRILQLNEAYRGLTENHEEYLGRNCGFLADAIEDAGDFSLKPLDMIAIWSMAMEVFPGSRFQRYTLAEIISSAYGILGVHYTSLWRRFPRYFLENGGLPSSVLNDRDGLVYFKGRIDEVFGSVEELDFYRYGTREFSLQLAVDLGRKAHEGDEEAKRQLERLTAHREMHSTPLLSEIHENFANGTTSLRIKLTPALQS